MSIVDERTGRRRTPGVPSKPETGLAEWTTKIKALQRQVDEDEEAETKRLEEEIAASRAARLRRSVGATSRRNSLDLSKDDAVLALKESEPIRSSDVAQSPLDRQRNQGNALRKLVGDGHGPSPSDRTNGPLTKPTPQSTPMSLAAFMGGRATGPRLTRQAPQQDAHDPTQFVQRTHISAPHPVFGRGGVAMPGMTGKEEKRTAALAYTNGEGSSSVTKSGAVNHHERDRKMSTPTNVRSFVEKVEGQQVVPPQKTGGSHHPAEQSSRQRTISTPTGVYSPRISARTDNRGVTDRPQPERHQTSRPVSHSPTVRFNDDSLLLSTPPQGRGSPFPSRTSPIPSRTMSTSPNPRSPAVVHTPPPQPMVSQVPKSPALSRSIQPEPRPISKSPHLPSPQTPPHTFLRTPAQKDPTPSISRLQGRGFVQSMVKVSSRLEANATPASPFKEKGQEAGRKATVLDRWQFDAGKSPGVNPASPPIISPKPVAMRKSRTFESSTPVSSGPGTPIPGYSPAPKSVKPDYTGRSLKSVASLPSMSQSQSTSNGSSRPSGSAKSERASSPPPLGSSKTMISYIKPTKTGEEPVTDRPPSRPSSRPPSRPPSAASRSRRSSPEVDEHGMRVRQRRKSVSGMNAEPDLAQGRRSVTPAPTSSSGGGGNPLSHPTKDRARKPRKARETTKEAVLSVKFKAETEVISDRPIIRSTAGISRPKSPSSHAAQVHRSSGSLHASTAHANLIHHSSPGLKSKAEDSQKFPGPSPHDSLVPPHEPRKSPQSLSPVEPTSTSSPKPVTPSPPTTSSSSSSQDGAKDAKKHAKPIRHSRIPSTGNRATVMDVAWALSEHEKHVKRLSGDVSDATLPVDDPRSHSPPTEPTNEPEVEELHTTSPDVKLVVANWGSRSDSLQTAPQMEKRKSSYEKYSAFVLPPLAEEKTPIQSPEGTLSRITDVSVTEVKEGEVPRSVFGQVPETQVEEPVKVQEQVEAPRFESHLPADPDYFEVERIPESLPSVDVDALLNVTHPTYKADPDVQTISADVMTIVGTSTTTAPQSNIFYDSEVLAIIHRVKTKSSGLVSTKVWSWCGKRAKLGEKEERKLQELARRYNTTLIPTQQYSESQELVSVLGGQLAIRQGTRARWTSDNTAMHLVRSVDGLTFIDELDLNVKNLCSGFSYCFSLLGTFYVWYGSGSLLDERKAALEYSKSMAAPSQVVELTEGDDDDDEMFWMMLGEREYAQADHWRWRPTTAGVAPRTWSLSSSPRDVKVVPSLGTASLTSDDIVVIDCTWEYFVVVGKEARARRRDIAFALTIANEMSNKTSSLKPFTPPVHVLVFPSQIPIDLRLAFRNMDEVDLNQGQVPDHMNLLHADYANQHLQRTKWNWSLLQDSTMLPLGLHPSDLNSSI